MKFNFKNELKIQESGKWEQLCCTYLPNGYHVTTCYRQSSADYGGWYYETFVWKSIDPKKPTGERDQVGDATGKGHVWACERILNCGEWKEEEEDEES